MMHSKLLVFSFLLVSSLSQAAIDVFEFDTTSQRQRYHQLVDELRCPKCQNQSLAGSNSQIAIDLRRELHRLLKEGKTDREIKAFMVARYGDFVLYRPPLRSSTLFLWLFPIILAFVGVLVLFLILYRRKKNQFDPQPSMSEKEQEALYNLLNDPEGIKNSEEKLG